MTLLQPVAQSLCRLGHLRDKTVKGEFVVETRATATADSSRRFWASAKRVSTGSMTGSYRFAREA
jgi:DNA-binding SARP family transcriptional activator